MADLAPQFIAAIKGDKGLYPEVAYGPLKAYRKDTLLKSNGSQWRALQAVPPGTTPEEGAFWTKFIDGTPVTDAAQVAADRILSQAAAATATAKEASVSTLALLVAGDKTAAQAAAATAVAVSGLANLSGSMRSVLTDSNVLAVFEYDTRKDSDGGAWVRKLNNSMINEPLNTATRGARREFPTISKIVAVATGTLYVFDADDPVCPLYKAWVAGPNNFFNVGSFSAGSITITAQQGTIAVAHSSFGVCVIDLIRERQSRITPPGGGGMIYLGNLAQCNVGMGYDNSDGVFLDGPRVTIAANTCNHVAMQVLPHAPPNPNRFGLPNPALVVATGSGISVIRHDGTAVNSVITSAITRVVVADDFTLYAVQGGGNTSLIIYPYPSYLTATFAHTSSINASTAPPSMMSIGIIGNAGALVGQANGDLAMGANVGGGLTLYRRDKGAYNRSATAFITDWFNTGWMFGSIKCALAESTRLLASLTGATKFSDNFSDNDVSDWTAGGGATLSGVGGELTVTVANTAAYNTADKTVSGLTIGQSYSVDFRAKRNGAHAARLGVNDGAVPGLVIASRSTSSTTYVTDRLTFTALSTSVTLKAFVDHPTPTVGSQAIFDDIVVKEIVGDRAATVPDVPGNCFDIVGTVNRVAIVAGGEAAGYSGFLANGSHLSGNRFNSPYNFGSGDFCVSVVTNGLSNDHAIIHFTDQIGAAGDGSGTNANWYLNTAAGVLRFLVKDTVGASSLLDVAAFVPAGLNHIVFGRRGNRLEVYVNGSLGGFVTTGIGSLSNASANLLIGAMYFAGVLGLRGSGIIGLAKFSTTFPTAGQIKAWAADELVGVRGKCLPQGGYIVQGLSYDRDADLLYAAKSAGGTDIWQGLSNKDTILGSASINKFANSGLATPTLGASGKIGGSGTVTSSNGIVASIASAGPGYVDLQVSGTSTATTNVTWTLQDFGFAPASAPGEVWTSSFEAQIVAGSISDIQLSNALYPATAGNVFLTAASTNFTPTGTNARYSTTHTAPATTAKWVPTLAYFILSGKTVNVTIRLRRPQLEKAAAFSAFVDGLTNSDYHSSVSASDGHVIIGTGNGADVVTPALPLRSGVRARRPISAYDPEVSRFNGRTTADATPTFIGNPVFVPEGGMVDFVMSVAVKVPGGTASERAKYLITGSAYRNIGDANATVSVQTNRPVDDETTAAMDATVVSMGGGWIAVRGTGKAATPLEWFGEQRLARAAA